MEARKTTLPQLPDSNDSTLAPIGADIRDQNGVTSLARGLRVLAALNDLEAATITRLVSDTGLAKSTLIRLLQTLISEGYAKRDPDSATYSVTPKVASLARALIGRDQMDAEIQQVLDDLADEIKWPTEFLVPDGTSMVIRLNNRVKAPIQLQRFESRRLPMEQSGAGLAYLAALPQAEQEAKIEQLTKRAEERDLLTARIAEASARGFASRKLHELARNLSVISVSVPGPVGAISLVHFDDIASDEVHAARHLPALRRAAAKIAVIFETHRPAGL